MLKVKEYLNNEEYDQDPMLYDYENDCPIEVDNFVAIVNRQKAFGDCKGADAIITCASAAPENKPLTLEQLRQMGGEPVWIALLNIAKQPTCEVITKICEDGIHTVGTEGSDYASFGLYGKTWLAYARKPEGSEKA